MSNLEPDKIYYCKVNEYLYITDTDGHPHCISSMRKQGMITCVPDHSITIDIVEVICNSTDILPILVKFLMSEYRN